MAKAILYDSILCVGCKLCEEGCAKKWNHPYEGKITEQAQLSAEKLTAIQTFGDRYSRRLCMHCADPTCASVCPVGAFEKHKTTSAVTYDSTKCIGCRYCMQACPFQVPSYEWHSRLPVVRKCDFCHQRQLGGQPTACTEACPTEATVCGERQEMIELAKRRMAEAPGQYHPKIYGLSEAGGLSVLYLSAVPFEQIGLKTNLPHHALPGLTWQALQHVPDVVSLGSVLLGGVWWITHRRDEVARAEGRAAKKPGKEPR